METTATRHQKRWEEIVRDPALQDLPYKAETNERGQIILSPHSTRHARQQARILRLLNRILSGDHLEAGEAYPEYPVATPEGVKQPDAVWVSREREERMRATGEPPTLAPEICVEILSASNTDAEMVEKRRVYREAGADEVWLVSEDGDIRFYADDELDRSRLAPECPPRVGDGLLGTQNP